MDNIDRLNTIRKNYNLKYDVYTTIDQETMTVDKVIFGVWGKVLDRALNNHIFRLASSIFKRRHGSYVKVVMYYFHEHYVQIGESEKQFLNTDCHTIREDPQDDGIHITSTKVSLKTQDNCIDFWGVTNFFLNGREITYPPYILTELKNMS